MGVFRHVFFPWTPVVSALVYTYISFLATTLYPRESNVFVLLGPFPPLEAVLRLVHAFAECGSYFSELIASGVFPQLIAAIHSTDVVMHPHPQVVMAYFEICSRYARFSGASDIQKIVSGMVGVQGLRSSSVQLRNRTAYLLLKLVEAIPSQVCNGLIPAVSSFSGTILITVLCYLV